MDMACDVYEAPDRPHWSNSEDVDFDTEAMPTETLNVSYLDAFKASRDSSKSWQMTTSAAEYLRGTFRSAGALARAVRSPLRVYGFILPRELEAVADRIAASHSMVGLADDWDGEGSPGYKSVTWLNAIRIVVNAATNYWETFDKILDPPSILRGLEGDIDIVWRFGSSTLIINVPSDGDVFPNFLATDTRNPAREISGTLDTRDGNGWLLEWLTQ